MPGAASALQRSLARLLGIRGAELPAVLAGVAMFLLASAGYFLLRPVREAMGIAGGVENLQWLFTATFVATLAAIPLFGWLAGRARRRRILPWTYAFFALNLVGFAAAMALRPDDPWTARAFYVWLSVFNLVAISVAWSVLADLFPATQASRLFAPMAAGISTGGLLGPALGIVLVGPIGLPGLLLLASALLMCSALAAGWLQRWRDAHPTQDEVAAADADGAPAPRADDGTPLHAAVAPVRREPLGGHPLAGIGIVLGSRYLLGIAAFVVLLASVTTFLYFEQARLVELHFPDREQQVRVFGALDFTVQALALATQLFLTGRIVRRFGLVVLLVSVPLVMAAGFLWLALAPTFAVFAAVMITRRAGEYALARPGREMLFTVVPAEAKYKAKNVIDSAVYRGADVVAAWLRTGIDAVASHPAAVALAGAGLALAWAGCGWALARGHGRRAATSG